MTIAQDIEPWEELYLYWLAKHVDGRPPSRADIDPMIDLPHLASSLLMIDLRPEGNKYRLVGSEIVSRFGLDHTGKNVGTSGLDERRLDVWRQAVDAAAGGGKPHLLVSRYPGVGKIQTVALLLPLAPDADGMGKLLGAAFFDQPAPQADCYEGLAFTELMLAS